MKSSIARSLVVTMGVDVTNESLRAVVEPTTEVTDSRRLLVFIPPLLGRVLCVPSTLCRVLFFKPRNDRSQ